MAGIISVGTLRIVKDKVKFISQSTLLVLIPSTSKYEPSLQLNCPTCLNTKEQCSLFPQNSLCYGTPAPLNYHPTSQNTATLKVKLKHYHLCFFLFAHKSALDSMEHKCLMTKMTLTIYLKSWIALKVFFLALTTIFHFNYPTSHDPAMLKIREARNSLSPP